MTELALRQEPQYDPPAVDPTGGRLVAWAAGLAAAHKIGTALCSTSFAPAHFRGKPDDAAAAILFGDEIGLSPTQSLRSIYVISGTPSLYARQMVALVLHHGHEVWTVEKTDAKVTVAGKRRGSSHVHEESWTTARAQRAGYTNNKKYQTDPSAMLYARAASDVCRQIAPDALAGLAYTVEEMELAEPEPTRTVSITRSKTTARRAPLEPAPEPDLEPPPLAADEPIPPDDEPDLITPKQQQALHAGLNDAGMGDRDAGLFFISDVLDRDVTTTKTLTRADASRVIDRLNEPAEPPLDADDAWKAGS